jgi:hypothetical protein
MQKAERERILQDAVAAVAAGVGPPDPSWT